MMSSASAKPMIESRRSLGDGSVSALGFGCMGMSEFYGPSDDEQSLRTLDAALDAGIDFYDTADLYGRGANEELLGRFIKAKRDRVIVATKFGISRQADSEERRIDNSPAYVRAACDASLKRLGTDRIDLYYCHRRSTETPVEEMMGALKRLVEEGKVRWVGLSEVSAETLRRAHAVHPVAAVQSEYSLWSRSPEDELLGTCRELGTAFVAYSPLGRGFLTGKLALAADDTRRSLPRFSEAAMSKNQALLDEASKIAGRLGSSLAQLALAWLLNKHPHVVPIFGTRSPARVAENAAAAALTLDTKAIAALDRLFSPDEVVGERYSESALKWVEVR